MLVQENLILLEKPSKAGSSSSDSTARRTLSKIRGVLFHLKTLYLFTRSDVKTVLAPQIIFVVAVVLSRERLTTGDEPASLYALRRLPLAVAWIWFNLIICGISNQRLPESILEDEHNKPWRPIADNRLTPEEAQKLLLAIIPLAMVSSLFLGGFTPTVTMMALLWMYNDLDGSSINVWGRNAINTGGIMCFSAGALEVMSGGQLLPKAWTWIGLTGAAIASTVQALDFPDMEGDRARDRQTIPLLYGETFARRSLAMAVVFWSAVCSSFWELRLSCRAIPLSVGFTMAVLTVMRRGEKCDKIVAKLWCMWMSVLYLLPLLV
ncbi:UbiA prenyltransferase [Colletotrichum truncatum]|uniref:UbiA prenyltransferase n=1 Tax=Colletotrichum truncatum TaxID=5467 RepID=A0ACC3YVV2_COLTU|nr:UbiA prenyltransferase [Colletotrichum truncatum]KAF6791196.1 UbiA prenyltransferase [Colletotrichum truncatum]